MSELAIINILYTNPNNLILGFVSHIPLVASVSMFAKQKNGLCYMLIEA